MKKIWPFMIVASFVVGLHIPTVRAEVAPKPKLVSLQEFIEQAAAGGNDSTGTGKAKP